MTASSYIQHATSELTAVGPRSAWDIAFIVFASCATLLGLCGNVLVVTAIATNKKLQRSANALNGSLAVADILVEATVMSLCILNDSMGFWPLGDLMCRVWISLDVMCTTASILSISGIAFDRYLHVRDPFLYDRVISRRVITGAIATIWALSVVISFLPVFLKLNEPPKPHDEEAADVSLAGSMFYSLAATDAYAAHPHPRLNLTTIFQLLSDDFSISPPNRLLMSPQRNMHYTTASGIPNSSDPILLESTPSKLQLVESREIRTCKFEANPIYAITSSTISFYIPCIVLVVVYAQLYRIARGHLRSIKGMNRVPRLTSVGGGSRSAFTSAVAVGSSPHPLTPIMATPRMPHNGSGNSGPSAISSRQSSLDNGNSIRLNGYLLEIHWPPTSSLKASSTSRENSNQSNDGDAPPPPPPPPPPNTRIQSVVMHTQESAAIITPNSENMNAFDLMSASANGSVQPTSLETSMSTTASSFNPLSRGLSTRRSSFGDALTIRSGSSNAAACATATENSAAHSNGSAGIGLIAGNNSSSIQQRLLSPHSIEGSMQLPMHNRKMSVSERNLAMVTSQSTSSSLNRFASTLLQVPFKLHSSNHSFFRDQKASITLGVIISSFLVCWFPFFTINGAPVFSSLCSCAGGVQYSSTVPNCVPQPTQYVNFLHKVLFVICLTVIAPICGNCISGYLHSVQLGVSTRFPRVAPSAAAQLSSRKREQHSQMGRIAEQRPDPYPAHRPAPIFVSHSEGSEYTPSSNEHS